MTWKSFMKEWKAYWEFKKGLVGPKAKKWIFYKILAGQVEGAHEGRHHGFRVDLPSNCGVSKLPEHHHGSRLEEGISMEEFRA